MDINNKEENLVSEQGKVEMKDAENFIDNNENETKDNNAEEVPKEVLQLTKPQSDDLVENNQRKKSYVDEMSDAGQPIGKRTMETILLNLNSYWLEIIGSISLVISVTIYEFLALAALLVIAPLFGVGEFSMEDIKITFTFVVSDIGLKWLFFITMSQHLSVGFLCLTTFSNVFQETRNIKKFYIVNCIKVVLFYVLSVIILKVIIRDAIGGYIIDKIKETNLNEESFNNMKDLLEKTIDKVCLIVGNFLATFNTFIEKTMFGTLYIVLLSEPKGLAGKKMLYFRLISIIPILYMVVSIILRALQNGKVIVISEYVSPLLLGPKITVYGFFVTTISMIKYNSIAYDVYDKEGYLDPKVFTKIGSKMFAIFAMVEMIIGLFFPSWSFVGIGSKYLMILCAPIMTLYDYRKKNEVHLPCCKQKDFSKCIKITLNVFGYTLIILLGILVAVYAIGIFGNTLADLYQLIADNWDWALEFASLLGII